MKFPNISNEIAKTLLISHLSPNPCFWISSPIKPQSPTPGVGELTKYPSASSDTHTHTHKSVSMLLCPYGEIIRDHFKSTRQRKVRSIQPCLRIVGINKQKPGLIPPAPKTSNLPTFQISKPVPNVLTTDMRNPWTTPSMLPKLHPSDENSNFQLLFARTTNKFRKRFRRKRPSLFKSAQWHFHQDNAAVRNSILVTDYLTKMGIKTVPYPPYSPDLAPCDFWLFPKLRGYRYETIEEMKEAVTKVIDTLTEEDFHGAFEKLLERYKWIAAGGDYFEGD